MRNKSQPASPAFPNSKRRNRYPRFDGYPGGKLWNVCHPDFGTCMVVAPSIPAAIVVAARVWNQTWTEYEFYSSCRAVYKGDKKGIATNGSAVI